MEILTEFWQDGDEGWQECHEVLQREMQSPEVGEEKPQVPAYAGSTQLGVDLRKTWGSWWMRSWTWVSTGTGCSETVCVLLPRDVQKPLGNGPEPLLWVSLLEQVLGHVAQRIWQPQPFCDSLIVKILKKDKFLQGACT